MSVVRPALRDIGEPIDAAGMANLIGGGITPKQARNALWQLVRTHEAVSTARGKYLWRGGESPAAEKPGADAPGIFNLAAE